MHNVPSSQGMLMSTAVFPLQKRIVSLLIFLIVLVLAGTAYSQGYRGRYRIYQNDPPKTELVVARWRFGTNGLIGHRGWSHNYPESDENLNEFIRRSTGINVDVLSYRIVDLGSDEIYEYPFAYVSEPGEMELTQQEVRNLREYVDRGGFVLMDDFDGPRQIGTMKSQVKRAFPGRNFIALDTSHPLFKVHFNLEDLNGMAPYVPGGDISYHGIFNDDGSLGVAAGFNNDLANFWEWYYQGWMPLKPSTDAFRLGVNAVVYAMTH
jgi:hypothetical protein